MYDAADPVPDDLVERVRFSLALDEMFDEVARMTRVPLDAMAIRSDQPAGTRTETLTFSADRLTAMVTVSRVGAGRLRLDGWLAPPEALPGPAADPGRRPTREVLADEQGRFSFDGLEEGFGQLSFHPVDDDAARECGRDPPVPAVDSAGGRPAPSRTTRTRSRAEVEAARSDSQQRPTGPGRRPATARCAAGSTAPRTRRGRGWCRGPG